ncbi:CAAX prenyl protease 2 isoform X1 [Neopsephotus bourkii]|uniref:CAAX prenyl protease 2 isoform X1 n=1 Tax=Neopsephotus bourkii TaxID=309878 RepID=UPI002AA556DD|nr:CAAX prenyl protease 2 isoform X1 [Neopsephotus bourkii]
MALSQPAGASSWAAAAPARTGPGPGAGPGGAPAPAAGPGPCWAAVLACLSLACSYVGSLYVWGSPLPRDHPSVIKRRFTSVLVVSGLSPAFVWLWKELTGVKLDTPLPALLGLRLEGLVPATLLPLLLTMILFLGPLIQLSMDCPWRWLDGIRVAFDPRFWALCLGDVRWLRNQVVAPLTEELVFRACMLPMLVPCTGPGPAVLACPLFFGVAPVPTGLYQQHLHVSSFPVLLHRRLRRLHGLPLPQDRSPGGPGAVSFLLQLHGLPGGGGGTGAPPAPSAAALLPAGGPALPPAPAPPHRAGFLRGDPGLCPAPRGPPCLLLTRVWGRPPWPPPPPNPLFIGAAAQSSIFVIKVL